MNYIYLVFRLGFVYITSLGSATKGMRSEFDGSFCLCLNNLHGLNERYWANNSAIFFRYLGSIDFQEG